MYVQNKSENKLLTEKTQWHDKPNKIAFLQQHKEQQNISAGQRFTF